MTDQPDDKIREYRAELGKRTTTFWERDNYSYDQAGDSPEVKEKGALISEAYRSGDLEKAKSLLAEALQKSPNELRYQNLKTLVFMLSGPVEEYKAKMKQGIKTLELAISKGSVYYAQASLTNLGVIAQNQGSEYAEALHLAAHFLNVLQLKPLQNLICFYSRHRQDMAKAMEYFYVLIDACPKSGKQWYERIDIVEWGKKDIDLSALRNFPQFIREVQPTLEKAWNKLKDNHKNI